MTHRETGQLLWRGAKPSIGRAGVIAAALVLMAAPAFAESPLVTTLVAEINQNQYTVYQQTIEDMGLGLYGGFTYNQGYRGRDAYSPDDSLGNQEARLYLLDQFTSMGLSVGVQGSYRNVVAELPGEVTPAKIYIVGAHYDTTTGNPRPGGDDNASGVAGILEAARVLSQYRFKSTIRFIGFNAEEDGLLGSKDYVANVVQAQEENVLGMMSLDMILRPANDANPSLPLDLDLACPDSADDLAWVDLFVTAAATYVSSLVIDASSPYTLLWGASDHQPFANNGYAAFLCIENTALEVFGGSNSYYHTADDWSGGAAGALYNYTFAANVVRAVSASLAVAAEILPEPITVAAELDWTWVYQNAPSTTEWRHESLLTMAVTGDVNGNTTYAATVTQDPASTGQVVIESTTDPLVWHIKGGRHGVDPAGAVTLSVTVTGNEHGGQGAADVPLTVRLLGDVTGSDNVGLADKFELNKRLNGLDTPGYEARHFDLDGNGAEPTLADKLIINKLLNGLPVP